MAVTDTDQVKPGTTEWAIYAALKQGGTLMSTDGLDTLVDETWESLPDSRSSKQVSVDLSVWINDSTRLVMIGPAGDIDIPAATTAEGVISVTATSYGPRDLEIELLGVSGKRQEVHNYSSALIALNDALDDWARNLIAALEH